jgi:thiol-disulfide isomerase/thioredoxin
MNKVLALVICLLLPPFVFAQWSNDNKLPAFSLKDLQGKTVKIGDFKGKVILINFWATWCVPCRAEIPELIKWQKEYKAQGLQIIGITYPPTNKKTVRSFARKHKINYPILFGSKETKELFDSGETMPFSILIDKEENIKERIEGVIFPEEFDEKIKPLLESDSEKRDIKAPR